MDLTRMGFPEEATVIITGAGSGIGQATALACARLGLSVGVWDIVEPAARATAGAITDEGGRAQAAVVDVADAEAVRRAVAATAESLGRPRYLVNNAGPRAADPYTLDEGLRLGAGSVAIVSEAFLAVAARPAAIVNVASVAGNLVGAEPVWYAANKAAIAGYTRALALQVAPDVRVNAVAPSLVNTPRMTNWTESDLGRHWAEVNPLERWAVPDDVAGPIVFLLSPLAGYVNGVLLPIDGGQTLIL